MARPVRRISRPSSAFNNNCTSHTFYPNNRTPKHSHHDFIREQNETNLSSNYRRQTYSLPMINVPKTKTYSVDNHTPYYAQCFGQHIRFMSHETLNCLTDDVSPEKKRRAPRNPSYYHDLNHQTPSHKEPVSIMVGVMKDGPPTIFHGKERFAL